MPAYPLPFPPKAPVSERLTISRKQSVSESTTTFAVQIVQSASVWSVQWDFGPMDFARAETIAAWIDSLNGQVGTFRYYPHQATSFPTGGLTLASAAYAYNTTISVGGYTAGAPSHMRAGQFFQLGDQLLRVTNAAGAADPSGQVQVDFQPELRLFYAPGAALNFTNPSGVFRMSTTDGLGYTLTPDRKPQLGTLQAREAV